MNAEKGDDLPRLHHSGNETHLLREILLTQQILMARLSRETGMPASRAAILRILAVTPDERHGVLDLARCIGIDAAAVTRQLVAMEEAGLVRRELDPVDKRRLSASLTPLGMELFVKTHERAHRFEDALTATIPAADVKTAARVMAAVRRAVEELYNLKETQP